VHCVGALKTCLLYEKFTEINVLIYIYYIVHLFAKLGTWYSKIKTWLSVRGNVKQSNSFVLKANRRFSLRCESLLIKTQIYAVVCRRETPIISIRTSAALGPINICTTFGLWVVSQPETKWKIKSAELRVRTVMHRQRYSLHLSLFDFASYCMYNSIWKDIKKFFQTNCTFAY
jgi:hypothetical protein